MWIPKPLVLPFRQRTCWSFYMGGDDQLGGNVSDEFAVREWVDEVLADQSAVWAKLGDIEDEDRPTTRIRRRSMNADRPEVNQRDAAKHLAWIDQKVIPIMRPLIKRRCLGILAGHHFTQITSVINSVQYICRKLTSLGGYPVPYLGQMESWAPVRFEAEGHAGRERIPRLFHLQHGTGGSQAVGSALKKLKKTADGIYADVYVRGHDLRLEATRIAQLSPGTGDVPTIANRHALLVNTGGASKSRTLTRGTPIYPESGGMGAVAMGWAKVNAYLRPYRDGEDRRGTRKWTVKLKAEI